MNLNPSAHGIPNPDSHHAFGEGAYFAGIPMAGALAEGRRLFSLGFQQVFVHVASGTLDSDKAKKSAGAYLHMMREMRIQEMHADVSLWPSAFRIVTPRSIHRNGAWKSDFPELSDLLSQTPKFRVRVWLNAELMEMRRDLWLLTEQEMLHGEADFLGITLQGYGQNPHDSTEFWESGMRPFVKKIPKDKTFGLRLCKGAFASDKHIYRDPETVSEKYLGLAKRILDLLAEIGQRRVAPFYPEFATCDPELISRIISAANERNTSKARFRFAMPLGKKQNLASWLVSAGYRVAIHIPFGNPFADEGKYHSCDAGQCHTAAEVGLI